MSIFSSTVLYSTNYVYFCKASELYIFLLDGVFYLVTMGWILSQLII